MLRHHHSVPPSDSSHPTGLRLFLGHSLTAVQYVLALLPLCAAVEHSLWVWRVMLLVGQWPNRDSDPLFAMPTDGLYDALLYFGDASLALSFLSLFLFPLGILGFWH